MDKLMLGFWIRGRLWSGFNVTFVLLVAILRRSPFLEEVLVVDLVRNSAHEGDATHTNAALVVMDQMIMYGGVASPPFRAAVSEYPWWQPCVDTWTTYEYAFANLAQIPQQHSP